MKWVEPQFSKKRVKRAGETLVDPLCSDSDKNEAMDVLSNWRSAHAYPMHAMLIFLRTRSSKIDKNPIVVQRLKRTPSIIGKLRRFDKMKLHRMQDIGGCRSVVKSTSLAEKLSQEIQNSRTRHKLHKVDDYIESPKESGYRGIHLVYKYNGEKIKYRDYFIEIQIRSKIQHAWATAVEIVDTFTDQALKASQGHKDWLDFFKNVSAEFARLENRSIGEYINGEFTYKELKRLENNLNAVNRLHAFAITTQHIAQQPRNKSDYFLLQLSGNPQEITVTQYPTSLLQVATNDYLELEKRAQKESLFDVVLVSASSMHSLKAAYPNYFADSREFLKYFSEVSANNAINSDS